MTPTLRAFPGVFLFLCLACVSPATAQTTFGSITGAVTDQTGSVIPGARVTVINEGNGAERRVETTNAGVFNVPNLNVGAYRVRIEAQGFRGYEQSHLWRGYPRDCDPVPDRDRLNQHLSESRTRGHQRNHVSPDYRQRNERR